MPYLLCTVLIGAFIFVVAIFGTDLVRKVASVLSICIIAGLIIVYVPNIISNFSGITDAVTSMQTAQLSLGDALYSAFLYGTFQLSNIAVFVQHGKSFQSPGDAVKSMGVGFVVNSLMMVMVVLGLMTVYTNPEAAGQSVPTLFMVQNGVGASFMTPLISILIILGAVSTAVNMVAAMVKRICGETKEKETEKKKFHITKKEVIAALVCCVVDFGIGAVRPSEPDSESLQRACLSGHPGHSGSVPCPYGRNKIGYKTACKKRIRQTGKHSSVAALIRLNKTILR